MNGGVQTWGNQMKSRIALAVTAFLPLACATHLHGPMTIPLAWAPTDNVQLPIGAAAAFKDQRVAVNPVADAREDRTAIGKNVEAKIDRVEKPEWAVATNTDVGSFLTERLLAVLQQNAITTVTTEPTRVIRLELLRYFVVEGDSYKADVGFRATVEDGQGRQMWQGLAEGSSNRFGHSYSPENYNEALSNAFLEAVKQLMQNPEMLKALGAT
jgi:hypothetical protein